VLDFAEQCVERLFEEGCRLVVVACHSVSCTALRHLQRKYAPEPKGRLRILGVTIPTAQAAVRISAGHIGIIGTARTVQSGTFATEIAKLSSHRVTAVAAPLLAPIVEEGWEGSDIARMAVERYVSNFDAIDTWCSHARTIRCSCERFERRSPAPCTSSTRALTSRGACSIGLSATLGSSTQGMAVCACYAPATRGVSGHARRFMGAGIPEVQHVAEEFGRLAHRDAVRVVVGQVVR